MSETRLVIEDKEMEEKKPSPMGETRSIKIQGNDPVQLSIRREEEETRKKVSFRQEEEETRKKVSCKACGKVLSQYSALHRHKKHHCKARIPILKLEWNGSTWVKSDNRFYYRLQLGRNLYNLIEKGAIKDDVLNCTQRKYVNMYKSLFSE